MRIGRLSDSSLVARRFARLEEGKEGILARRSGLFPEGMRNVRVLYTAGLDPVDRKGFVFNPVTWSWRISDRDLSVNYVTSSVKPA